MVGKIKALGFTFLVVAAMSLMGASAASAGSVDVGTSPAVLTGESLGASVLTVTDQKGNKINATCPTSSIEGTTTGATVTEGTATATYGPGCTLFGVNATVQMNGCKFTLTGSGQAALTIIIDIVGCTSGKKIEIKSAVCTITIGEQNGIPHIVINTTTTAGIFDIHTTATFGGITSTQDGVACPDGNAFTAANASVTGTTTIRAYFGSGTQQVTKHNHQYTENTCGAQVSLTAT